MIKKQRLFNWSGKNGRKRPRSKKREHSSFGRKLYKDLMLRRLELRSLSGSFTSINSHKHLIHG